MSAAPRRPHRLGLLGGTFNPPHVGHLVMAQEAATQLGLDHVCVVPVAVPPHKELRQDPGPELRARLCELAVAGDERFSVSRIELDRGGPSYTVDTLRSLHAADPERELTFIVGADNVHGLAAWRSPEEVLRLARLAVAERAGIARTDLLERLASFDTSRIDFFDMPRIDVSSSSLRERVAQGRPIRYLVPDAVAAAIGEHQLYQGDHSA